MALRKVPGALALGLLASLVAHGALYGGEHSMGGDYHDTLVELALAAGIGLALFFAYLGWCNARFADGSVLAARLADRLPGFGSLFAAATLWYAAVEYLEPHHPGALRMAVLLVIAAACWLIRRFCRYALAVLAGAILAVLGNPFAPRAPSPARFTPFTPPQPPMLWARRRFARPPPIGCDCCA